MRLSCPNPPDRSGLAAGAACSEAQDLHRKQQQQQQLIFSLHNLQAKTAAARPTESCDDSKQWFVLQVHKRSWTEVDTSLPSFRLA